MSRSNPTDNSQNPSKRWFEWDGSNGNVRYYDKEKKEQVKVKTGFSFILLDELATIKGWHDASDSGIYSNEVRDTREQRFIVKAFEGGKLAEGLYAEIRDRVVSQGGHFTANLYIAFKLGSELQLGSIQFKGAALSKWMEFKKSAGNALWNKAVKMTGCEEGKKGKITFQTPIFVIHELTEDTQRQALALDGELQKYLEGYFKRTKTEQVTPTEKVNPVESEQDRPEPEPEPEPEYVPDDSDVPL